MPKVTPLKIEIVKRGLVQADIAQSAGIHESRFSRIVNGRVKPFDYEVKQIAQAIGVPKEELPV